MSSKDTTEELRQRKTEARQSGGPERMEARHRKGVGSARERVEALLDPDTFVELDVFVEGAVTGHGKVNGRDVYVFSLDGEASADVVGEGLSRKVLKMADQALANGAPLVGIYDCSASWAAAGGTKKKTTGKGDGAASLGEFAGLCVRQVMASGAVPQIAAVVGPVGGAAAYSPVLADLVVMVKGEGRIFLGDPGTAKSAGAKAPGLEQISGARALSEEGGVVHVAADDEGDCFDKVRALLSYLPQNNLDDVPISEVFDPVDRMDAELDSLAGRQGSEASDVRDVIGHVFDKGSFQELLPYWAKSMVVGFAHLGGRAVGVVANQPTESDGRLDADAADKGARFVRMCDAFNLPIVCLVDTPGLVSGDGREQGRLTRAAGALMYAFCEATVPKLTVVTGRALAEGFEVMCSKNLGADFNLAWPGAEIGIRGDKVASGGDRSSSPYDSAVAGHLDDVFEPSVTRPRLVAALEACISKRDSRPPKKHGNLPL